MGVRPKPDELAVRRPEGRHSAFDTDQRLSSESSVEMPGALESGLRAAKEVHESLWTGHLLTPISSRMKQVFVPLGFSTTFKMELSPGIPAKKLGTLKTPGWV